MLALLIVYYHHPNQLNDFLASLVKNRGTDFKLYIADLSEQLTLTKKYAFPIQIISGPNKGYSYGVNLGLKQALKDGCDQFCVLNYDTILDQQFIKNLKIRFQTSEAFSGKIYYAPGHEYHHLRYQKQDLGKVLWYAGGTIDWNHATTTHRGVDEVDRGQYSQLEETDFIPGTLCAFSKKVLDRVGWWDERFFLYYEDADYSVRIKKAGFKLIYDPKIVIWHKNAATTGGSGSALHVRTQAKSRLWFGLKHAPIRTKIHLLLNYILLKSG